MKDVVLITGIGKRLGLELARHYLAKGDIVIGTYRAEYPSIEELHNKGAELYQVNFYDQQALNDFIYEVAQQYSSIRTIIHNASDWLPDNAEMPKSDILNRMMTIHVSVPYQINLGLQTLLENNVSEFSDIIHISDYVSAQGSKKHIAYAASKSALNNLTLSFATLLAPKVKVNSISPALVKFNPHDDDNYKQKALNKALIQSEAGFEELINAIEFITKSRFMTGRNMQLDGGRHLK